MLSIIPHKHTSVPFTSTLPRVFLLRLKAKDGFSLTDSRCSLAGGRRRGRACTRMLPSIPFEDKKTGWRSRRSRGRVVFILLRTLSASSHLAVRTYAFISPRHAHCSRDHTKMFVFETLELNSCKCWNCLKYDNRDGRQPSGQVKERIKLEFTRRKQEVDLIQAGKGGRIVFSKRGIFLQFSRKSPDLSCQRVRWNGLRTANFHNKVLPGRRLCGWADHGWKSNQPCLLGHGTVSLLLLSWLSPNSDSRLPEWKEVTPKFLTFFEEFLQTQC